MLLKIHHLYHYRASTASLTVPKPTVATDVPRAVEKGATSYQSKNPDIQQRIEIFSGMPLEEMINYWRQSSPQELKQWFEQRKNIAQILDAFIWR